MFLLINIKTVGKVITAILTVLSPVFYGLIIAYMLNYPYKLFSEHIFKKMGTKHKFWLRIKKPLSMILAYVIVFGIVTYLICIIVPELSKSISMLVDNVPAYSNKIVEWINNFVDFVKSNFNYDLYEAVTYEKVIKALTGSNTSDFINKVATEFFPAAISTAKVFTTGLYNWIIGIIISIYLLSGKERLLRQSKKIVLAYLPRRFHKRVFKVADICNNKCGKYIIGKIIDSSIIGVICFIGLSIFRFDYALLISVIIGVTNIIPFFGPIIGAIPCAFLLLIINPMECLWFIIFIVVLQQFDGNILGPKILGETVGLSGFWILFSVLVGGGLFGVLGMLLGVPVFAVIYSLVEESVYVKLKKKKIDPDTAYFNYISDDDNKEEHEKQIKQEKA